MMALLSRTAEHLYWLGRHVERVESVARIVREHTHLLVDVPIDVESDWSALLAITGTRGLFDRNGGRDDETGIVAFLMSDIDNPGSIVRSLLSARENLRVSRQIVPGPAWECLNRLHITVASDVILCGVRSRRLALCRRITDSCQHFAGILAGTMSRDHAFAFYELGRNIERADMTTRVLDVRAGSLMTGSGGATEPADRSPFEDVRWLGVLRSTSGEQMYHRSTAAPVEGDTVLEFLVHDPHFPHSIAHSVAEVRHWLDVLPDRPDPQRACERVIDVLGARLPRAMPAVRLHEHMDRIQAALGAVHSAISATFFVTGHRALASSDAG